LLSDQYARDAAGRIISKLETILGTTHTYSYTYDLRDRLTVVSRDGTVASQYGYDANGNRVSASGVVSTSGTLTGTYDVQDRLLQYGTTVFTYTASGVLQAKSDTATNSTTTYTYDTMGNLTQVVLPDGTRIGYLIDGNNRRISRTVNGILAQGFLYGSSSPSPVAQLDGSGNLVSRFVYGGSGHAPAYMIRGGVTYRIITDNLGSPRLVVDAATGNIAQRIDYDEFGNVVTDTNPGFQPFGFAGGLYDPRTGLTRFGFRDYDPSIGRWTAPDPILFDNSPANLYVYANDDPVKNSDPLGLFAISLGIGASGGIGAGVSGSVQIVWTSNGDIAIQSTAQANAVAGASAGVGPQLSISPNSSQLSDLEGNSVVVGGSGGPFGAEVSRSTSQGSSGGNPVSINLSVAKSIGADAHIGVSHTETVVKGSVIIPPLTNFFYNVFFRPSDCPPK
jgi:RHS repeat-associated protein